MGEQKVHVVQDEQMMQMFVKSLLDDVQALEIMLEDDWFEKGITRIGAEQEMVMVDSNTFKPALIAEEILEELAHHDWMGSELGKFNLEINLTPRELKGSCFSDLMHETITRLSIIQDALDKRHASIVLTGILPTFRKFDLDLHNLTPKPRYKALMQVLKEQMANGESHVRLEGIDELMLKHNSPLIEACNTSFQVHLQVAPNDFVHLYNIAQTLAGPVMAIAANSPIVFGKRLWHESRIAMFQQALDTRSSQQHMRERSPRVHFGKSWMNDSILDIYREDIARYRVLLASEIEEESLELIKNGKVPKLKSLQVHNSTVYRWNRPCYGISENGKPHLRIENRVFASGPTVMDEVANAAFWLGCMLAMGQNIDDVRRHLSFEDIRDNFEKAAKFGIDTKFNWLDDRKIPATDLILKELLPLAHQGLQSYQVDQKDIDHYLGIIEKRAATHLNGARWSLRAYTKLLKETSKDEALSTLTSSMIENTRIGIPGHEWPLPELRDLKHYQPAKLVVSEFMTTDLFTVRKDDIIQFVAQMMDWRKIRYMPVEDENGHLVGLITSRLLLRYYSEHCNRLNRHVRTVEDIMIANPITINPDATLLEAMEIMKDKKIGCLPVVVNEYELIGIITEMDFLRISTRLIERLSQR